MLPDLLTALLILEARNEIAARQFLHYLTTAQAPLDAAFAADYPKMILHKAVALSRHGAQDWLQGLY
jgi:hypothetical protein